MNIHKSVVDALDDASEDWYKSILMTNKRQNILLVACLNGRVAGFLHLYYGGGRGYIETIAVKEEFRGMGIGTELLFEAEKILKRKGVETIKLNVKHSNLKALIFYLKNGYSIDGVTMIMKGKVKELKREGEVKWRIVSLEEKRRLEGMTSTWWSMVTEKADIEIYKYYKGEISLAAYDDKFCGIAEFETERELYVDYMLVSYSNPSESLRTLIHGLRKYAEENGVEEIIVPVDSTKKLFLQTMIEEGFKIFDTEYRLSKDLD
ncbi:MAG: GNAT family N-acetyltransferase [Candidatus Methanomethylicia archaeon]